MNSTQWTVPDATASSSDEVTHDPEPHEMVPDGYWPVMADERSPGVEFVEVDVIVLGSTEGRAYGLRGDKLLGWGHSNRASASVMGWMPPGETTELVTIDPYDLSATAVPVETGGTRVGLTSSTSGLFALVDLRTAPPEIDLYETAGELHAHAVEALPTLTTPADTDVTDPAR